MKNKTNHFVDNLRSKVWTFNLGFPTLKLFPGGVKGIPNDYNGERKAASISNAVLATLTSKYIVSIGGSGKKALDYDHFVGEREMGRVILVTAKSDIPYMYQSLSVQFKDRLTFGLVKVCLFCN
jgi:protein disulfide-isomerase A6